MSIEKKVFVGSTQEEASRQADEWWDRQKGLRLIQRTLIAVGDEGRRTVDLNQWAVTIHFDGENSN